MQELILKKHAIIAIHLIFLFLLTFYAPTVFAEKADAPTFKSNSHLMLAKGHHVTYGTKVKCRG